MTLQSSGPISLEDIQFEFGGTNPISISEYYGEDTGIPTSGTISFSDFYGKSSGVDTTPNTVNWGSSLGPGNASTPTQTINGIAASITLEVTLSGSITGTKIQAFVNGSLADGITNNGSFTFNVSNGNTVYFEYTDPFSGGATQPNGNFIVRNLSDGSTILDTLNLTAYSFGI